MIDPRIKEAKRLLWQVTNEQRAKEKKTTDSIVCECKHVRKSHSVSYNINYTGGMCKRCPCQNYIEDIATAIEEDGHDL